MGHNGEYPLTSCSSDTLRLSIKVSSNSGAINVYQVLYRCASQQYSSRCLHSQPHSHINVLALLAMRGLRDGREIIGRLLWPATATGRPRKSSVYLPLTDGASDDNNGWSQELAAMGDRMGRLPVFRRPRLFLTALVLITLPIVVIFMILSVRTPGHCLWIYAECRQPPPPQGPFFHEFPR